MPEKSSSAAASACRDSVCVHTKKIFDSCRDKDCIEDLRVYPTCGSQAIIDSAFSIRPRDATLLYADVRVEEMNFNRGCYAVDVTYFYKVTGRTFPGDRVVTGLAIFDKRVVLYGGEGGSKMFTSKSGLCCTNSGNLPTAIVEAVDPLLLAMKIVDAASVEARAAEGEAHDIPREIRESFDDEIITTATCKQLYATLGQFTIIRLERDTQLLMPVYDYCIPDKECAAGSEEDPCTLFSSIPFPVSDFFPPQGNADKCTTNGPCSPSE
jgi:hypothetical protein